MRILVISSVFPNSKHPLYGVFVKERMARVARGCELVVVAPVPWFPFNRLFRGVETEGIPAYEVQDSIPVYHPKFLSVPGVLKCLDGFFYFLSVLPLARRLRRSFRFDLIDAHFAYPDGFAGCLLAKVFRCPVIVTLRGTIGKLSKFVLRRVQIQWVLRTAARVIAVSDSLGSIANSLGAAPEKMRVIPNGVDTTTFHPSDREGARKRLGFPLNETVILSVGALSERKGHHRVLQVLPRIAEKRPDVRYVVVGEAGVEGNIEPLLSRLSKELGVQDRVRLVGARPHEEIAQWLAAADVFCLATSNEGMANVILESLACGVPVVTTQVGGNAELISHEENGYLVPLGDPDALGLALLRALEGQWNREKIAGELKRRSWDATATRVLEEFLNVVSNPASEIAAEDTSVKV